MTNIAVLSVQNTSSEVEIRSPSARSMSMQKSDNDLPACKVVLAGHGDFDAPATMRDDTVR